jgi:hypothetical protein
VFDRRAMREPGTSSPLSEGARVRDDLTKIEARDHERARNRPDDPRPVRPGSRCWIAGCGRPVAFGYSIEDDEDDKQQRYNLCWRHLDASRVWKHEQNKDAQEGERRAIKAGALVPPNFFAVPFSWDCPGDDFPSHRSDFQEFVARRRSLGVLDESRDPFDEFDVFDDDDVFDGFDVGEIGDLADERGYVSPDPYEPEPDELDPIATWNAFDGRPRCSLCGVNPVERTRVGLCATCRKYQQRHGRSRPRELTERQGALNARYALKPGQSIITPHEYVEARAYKELRDAKSKAALDRRLAHLRAGEPHEEAIAYRCAHLIEERARPPQTRSEQIHAEQRATRISRIEERKRFDDVRTSAPDGAHRSSGVPERVAQTGG